jgi:hypothetical protein
MEGPHSPQGPTGSSSRPHTRPTATSTPMSSAGLNGTAAGSSLVAMTPAEGTVRHYTNAGTTAREMENRARLELERALTHTDMMWSELLRFLGPSSSPSPSQPSSQTAQNRLAHVSTVMQIIRKSIVNGLEHTSELFNTNVAYMSHILSLKKDVFDLKSSGETREKVLT